MRKDILKYVFILALAIVVSILIYFHFDGNKNIEGKDSNAFLISERTDYKSIKLEEIKEIEIAVVGEMVFEPIIIEDRDQIEEIYNALGKIVIRDESDVMVLDDEFTVIIKAEDKTVSFCFEGNYIVQNNKRYETYGLSDLKKLIEQE